LSALLNTSGKNWKGKKKREKNEEKKQKFIVV